MIRDQVQRPEMRRRENMISGGSQGSEAEWRLCRWRSSPGITKVNFEFSNIKDRTSQIQKGARGHGPLWDGRGKRQGHFFLKKQKQMQTSTQRMDKKATSYHIAQGTLFNALHDKPEWKSI